MNIILNNTELWFHVLHGNVADVFAGSGSVGLEMLSRGANTCVFYENDHTALKALKSNIHAFDKKYCTLKKDALHPTPESQAFDCVFFDAPYTDASLNQRAINAFITHGLIDKNTLIIVQINTKHTPPTIPNFHISKDRKVAGGHIYFYLFYI